MARSTVIRKPTGAPAVPDALAHALELMQGAGPVVARRMFGGHGLFADGRMFGIWIQDQLYFKVDTISEPAFATRGLPAFTYTSKGKTHALGYRQAPSEAFDEAEVMVHWVRQAQATAARAATQGQAGKRAVPARKGKAAERGVPKAGPGPVDADQAASWPNLGPASQAMLAAAGIHRWAQLQELGAVRAYLKVKRQSPKASLNLLWALEGALSGKPWQQVAQEDRASLLMALEDAQQAER